MRSYRFNGKKGQFHVLAAVDMEQRLIDRISAALGHLTKAALVAPVLTHHGERLQHHTRPTAYLDRNWVWVDPWQDDAEADPDVGDVLLDGVVLPPPPPGAPVDLPLYEYKVCVEFVDPYSNRPRDWALRLLNADPLCPLIAATTPLVAGTEEGAVETMLTDHCCAWGAFTLDQPALVLLLHQRYNSLLDEPEVVETIVKHVPLKKIADPQYQRDVLGLWKGNFPGEADRLQPRGCEQPLLLPNLRPCAPYKVGWHDWMRVNVHQLLPMPDNHVVRPLLLIGPPTSRMMEWARSHDTHAYMQGRLDLAYLHDCLQDVEGARYVVLDELPWSLMLREEGHCHSVLTNSSFQWYHGRRVVTTTQRLPVIILKSHLPNPDDPCWAPRGWQHWKSILQITKLLPNVPLFTENTATPNKGAATAEAAKFLAAVRAAAGTPTPASGGGGGGGGCSANTSVVVSKTSPSPSRPRTRQQSQAMADVVECEKTVEPSGGGCSASKSDVTTTSPPTTRPRTRQQSQATADVVEWEPPASALKLDFARRIQYGPDSFLYPDAIPVAHRKRLADVVAAIDYVQMQFRGRDLARQKDFQSDNIAGSYAFYEYTGSVPDVWHQGDWSPELLDLRDALREATGEPINSMVGNQYLDGEATIGHHSDKTPDIQRGTSISTVSLGATRLFELHRLDGRETLSVPLTDGSVFQIGPLTNVAYTHSIPPMAEKVGPRYGLTFRTLASRWLHDEEVALRQPARDGDPWLVEKKATRLDENGQVVLRQDGYPSRRGVHLAPFELDDPSHVQEADIIRLRQRLRATTATTSDKQKRASETGLDNQQKRQRKMTY